jgi:hypothetical protein
MQIERWFYSDLDNFVRLHASRLPRDRDTEPTAYLVDHNSAGIALDCVIKAYSIEDVKTKFDTDDAANRWLLQQMMTYDRHESYIMGLIFSQDETHRIALAHVVKRGCPKTEADDDSD